MKGPADDAMPACPGVRAPDIPAPEPTVFPPDAAQGAAREPVGVLDVAVPDVTVLDAAVVKRMARMGQGGCG